MVHSFRCWLCEVLTSWALKVSPADYVPAMIEACVDAYKKNAPFDTVEEPECST